MPPCRRRPVPEAGRSAQFLPDSCIAAARSQPGVVYDRPLTARCQGALPVHADPTASWVCSAGTTHPDRPGTTAVGAGAAPGADPDAGAIPPAAAVAAKIGKSILAQPAAGRQRRRPPRRQRPQGRFPHPQPAGAGPARSGWILSPRSTVRASASSSCASAERARRWCRSAVAAAPGRACARRSAGPPATSSGCRHRPGPGCRDRREGFGSDRVHGSSSLASRPARRAMRQQSTKQSRLANQFSAPNAPPRHNRRGRTGRAGSGRRRRAPGSTGICLCA